MKKISVLILEEHLLFREALARVLSFDKRFEVIGVTGEIDDVLSYCSGNRADVVLVGTHMVPVDGFKATAQIKGQYSHVKVIGLSVYKAPVLVKKFMRLGASGYLTKNASCSEFVEAILAVNRGETYLSAEVSNALMEEECLQTENASGWSSLTAREMLIVQGVKKGKTSRVLAVELGLSPKTVEAHRYRILKKLNLKSSVALVQFAIRQGI